MKIAHHTFEHIYQSTSNPDVSSMQISFQVDDVSELHHALVKLWSYCIARITGTCDAGAASWSIDYLRMNSEMVGTISTLFDKIGVQVHIDGAGSPRGPLSSYMSCVSSPEFTHTIQFSMKGPSTMNCHSTSRLNFGALFS